MDIKEIENKIINADCMDILKQLPDKCVDLLLTDIPYGECNRESNGLRNFNFGVADVVDFNLQELLTQIVRIIKGSIYIFCGTEQVSEIRSIFVNNGLSTRLLIWEKTNPVPTNGQNIWLSGIECCVYGKFKGGVFNEKCKNTILRYPICSDFGRFHTTQKPLNMFEYLIKVSTDENNLVLDCFSGSGTTAIACHRLKRRFICIEKDPEYWAKSVERLKHEQAQLQLF